MFQNRVLLWCTVAIATNLLSGCARKDVSDENRDELAQVVGDLVASIDEFGDSSGSIAQYQRSFQKLEDRLDPHFKFPEFLPKAQASIVDSCFDKTSFKCESRTLTRSFNDCKLGLATFSGSISLTYDGSGTGCSLGGLPGSITRLPDFTVAGLRGAILAVSKSSRWGYGQRISFQNGALGPSMKFSSDGIRRVFTLPGDKTLVDFTSKTLSDLTITGADRKSRMVSGGTVRVSSNLEEFHCDFSPKDVKWTEKCNCPVSGSWEATCSDGRKSSVRLNGCGTAEFEFDSEVQTVSLERCAPLF